MYDEFVYVECYDCDERLHDTDKIFVVLDLDIYVCDECVDKYAEQGYRIVPVMEY